MPFGPGNCFGVLWVRWNAMPARVNGFDRFDRLACLQLYANEGHTTVG
jgi:hypothetical protein